MTFFPAKAEVKTEGEKVNQERKAGSKSWCKMYQTTSKSLPFLFMRRDVQVTLNYWWFLSLFNGVTPYFNLEIISSTLSFQG